MNEFCWLQVSSEINNALGILHSKGNESIVTVSTCGASPSLRCKGLASAVKVLGSSSAFVASLGNWSFQWHMMWPSSLGSWGTFVSLAQLDSWALSAVIFSSVPDPSHIPSCEKPDPSPSEPFSPFISSLTAPFLQQVMQTLLFPTLLFPFLALPSLSSPWPWHSLCLLAGNNIFSSWKISGDELVVWQIKHKQLQKAILKYLSVSVYSSARWITWVIKTVEEKNLMEMIIWLLSIILPNQAHQLHTSRLFGCLWDFLFYYLNLIRQLIAGPYVPFHTVYPWTEKQQLFIYFILFYGCAAVKPHRAEGSVPFSASSRFKHWENTRDIFIYRCTYWGANKLVSMSTWILLFYLAFVWKPLLCVLSRHS